MMLFASSGDRASVSAKAPLIANDFSEQVQVNVLAATGEAHAPKASYVLLTWYLVPDASDYTRTDTYTLTVDQAGVRTELIHPPGDLYEDHVRAWHRCPRPNQVRLLGRSEHRSPVQVVGRESAELERPRSTRRPEKVGVLSGSLDATR